MQTAEDIIARIVPAVELPVTADFEGGYSGDDDVLAENITSLLKTGVAGINFEDRIVAGTGLYDIARQARRIAVIRRTAERRGVRLFINARSDVFFTPGHDPAQVYAEALDRAKAYAAAGASGLFLPGLTDAALIGRLCERVTLPVNIMVMEGAPSNAELAARDVARISYGNIPYVRAMQALGEGVKVVLR